MTHTNNDSRIPLYRWVMHGAVMLGRAFCYAMQTALVTPLLLQIGLPEQYYSLTWFPSPILGLILSPVIGSLSDRCTLRLGRRRPFILALCVGVLLGVALFLNGSLIGLSLGDSPGSQPIGIVLTVLGVVVLDFFADATEGPIRAYLLDVANTEEQDMALNIHSFAAGIGGAVGYMLAGLDWTNTALGRAFKYQEQILFLFTAIIFIISVILHMFSIPEQPYKPPPPTSEMVELQPTILLKPPQVDGQADDYFDSTDSIALLEQSMAVHGDKDGVSISGPSHPVRGDGSAGQGNRPSTTSFPSHPQMDKGQHSFIPPISGRVVSQVYHQAIPSPLSLNDPREIPQNAERRCLSSEGSDLEGGPEGVTTVRLLWLSMLKMPSQLWRLCVCHLITWFSVLAEGLFFTDFMGQVVYHGDPTAPANSVELQNYHKGVQMGCWGLMVYAASAAVSSALLQKYLDNFHLSIKVIYMLGTLGFSIGTAVMAIFPNVYIAVVMISSMGVMDMTISYCPYALLGQYHEIKEFIQHSPENSRRGFGIDCAILSCHVYFSQILVASALSTVVDAVGSVRVIPVVASVASFLGFLTACFLVIYPNRQRSSEHRV